MSQRSRNHNVRSTNLHMGNEHWRMFVPHPQAHPAPVLIPAPAANNNIVVHHDHAHQNHLQEHRPLYQPGWPPHGVSPAHIGGGDAYYSPVLKNQAQEQFLAGRMPQLAPDWNATRVHNNGAPPEERPRLRQIVRNHIMQRPARIDWNQPMQIKQRENGQRVAQVLA